MKTIGITVYEPCGHTRLRRLLDRLLYGEEHPADEVVWAGPAAVEDGEGTTIVSWGGRGIFRLDGTAEVHLDE